MTNSARIALAATMIAFVVACGSSATNSATGGGPGVDSGTGGDAASSGGAGGSGGSGNGVDRTPGPIAARTYTTTGTTYWVATDGDDGNPGSSNQPWRTIQKAANTLAAGDTVFVRAGTYAESVVPRASGTDGHVITYAAAPGATVIIDGTGVTTPVAAWGGLVHITGKSYLRFSGFQVRHSTVAGIYVEGQHIVIDDNSTNDSVNSGIGIWKSQDVIVEHNDVALACNDGSQECLTVAQTSGFEVRYNHVHDGGPGTSGGEGIDAKDGSSSGKVYGNWVHDIVRLGIYVDAWDKQESDIDVFGNLVHDCQANGFALATENGGLLQNVHVFNNVAHSNKNVGITVAGWGEQATHQIQNVWIVNNTFVNNGLAPWGGGIQVDNAEASAVTIKNNVVAGNLTFQIVVGAAATPPIIDHNLIQGFRASAGETRGTDFVQADPLFVDTATFDYHLGVGSPAIDAGSATDAPDVDFDGVVRPQGAGIDIGAFEKP